MTDYSALKSAAEASIKAFDQHFKADGHEFYEAWCEAEESFYMAAREEVVLAIIAENKRLTELLECAQGDCRQAMQIIEKLTPEAELSERLQEEVENVGGLMAVITRMAEVLKRLTFCARTTGGTAGPDALLMMACDDAEKILSLGGLGAVFMTGADDAEAKEPSNG